ncbi:ABC transporter permease [Polaromonas sp. JS666]|uniref:ABC transporter permease n=1 Tax=Polaromonas sp. (strain JS666 / ATCC BAA-500) TaxID=296591 RepID=UPI00087FDCC7|nr:ABC transporter permease [Polaromonas sp. JS666]SDO08601.1 monosaccharide ABC transporter membrane protein, CUT2 family [Polaromonas sp. JS666]
MSRRGEWRMALRRNGGPLAALAVFIVMFALFLMEHPRSISAAIVTTASNKAVLLAIVAMAQTLPVITRGLDLSVGMVMVLTGCLASTVVNGAPWQVALGIVLVLACGAAAGALNGAIVVFGRLQPIIVTLATGAVYFGFALLLRPAPGGEVSEGLSDALTGRLFGVIPATMVLLAVLVVLGWMPLKRTVTGRACYAVGSSEQAAYLSGVPSDRAKFLAYTVAGLLSGVAGLLLSLIALSGEASGPQAGLYTLNSIAAVVIGGTSLYGGTGGMVGSILGAFVLRTIGDLLFVFNAPALWQPLFEGLILLAAVCMGAARVLRVRNRLELF